MFRKLISNLPFNPSLLDSVSFYAQRMKAEESLRRLGFGFVALAMFIQMFAVLAPPEKSLAQSNDYIINGIRTRDDILRAWDGQTSDRNVAAIYSRFGLTREDIAALPLQPNARIRSDSADYWTIGRSSLSAVSKSSQIKQQYKNSEIPVNYGSGTVYLRQLRAWDIRNSYNTYNAFQGTKNGQKFWILVDCGNFTQVGTPNLTPPEIELHKTIKGGPRTLKPGDEFTFQFQYRNKVPNSQLARNVVLNDEFDLDKFEVVRSSPTLNFIGNGKQIALPLGDVAYSETYRSALVVTVRLKKNLPNNTKACNAAKLTADNAADAWSGGAGLCITTLTPPPPAPKPKPKPEPEPEPEPEPCPLDSSLEADDPNCFEPAVACSVTNTDVNKTTKEFTLTTVAESTNPKLTKIISYSYDYGDGSATRTQRSAAYTDTSTHTYSDGSYTATVEVNYKIGAGTAQKDGSTSCQGDIDSEADKPLTRSKTARNLTQDLDEEATPGSKAKAGDTIEYSLTTTNDYGYARANVNFSDDIGDILDYADLDLAFLKQQGGTYDEDTQTISWTNQTIKANSSLTTLFRVKLKDPLPSTNQPSPLTNSFDCNISNTFGNQVDIAIDCPLPKSAEYLTQSLPKTGPGTSLIIGFTATAVVAYFFARSRLLRQELELIRTDFARTGGV